MPTDYAKAKPSRGKRKKSVKRSSGSRSLWLMTGLLMGLVVTHPAYVKEHLTNIITAFKHAEQNDRIETPKNTVKIVHRPHKANNTDTASREDKEEKMQFDFYTLLPKMQVVTPGDQKVVSAAPPKAEDSKMLGDAEKNMLSHSAAPPSAAAAPIMKKPPIVTEKPMEEKTPKISTHEKFLVQIASFKRFEEADEFKAKLAMMGFETNILSYGSGKTEQKRVMLGPYSTQQEASQTLNRLADNHMKGVIIKLEE